MITLSQELMEELDGMIEEEKKESKWNEERKAVIKYLADKATSKDIARILKLKYPDYDFTLPSVDHAIRRYREEV